MSKRTYSFAAATSSQPHFPGSNDSITNSLLFTNIVHNTTVRKHGFKFQTTPFFLEMTKPPI